jgi:tetratricopeptide (TPR) repeat protein
VAGRQAAGPAAAGSRSTRANRKAPRSIVTPAPTPPASPGGPAASGRHGGPEGGGRPHRYHTSRPPRIRYYDRPGLIRHSHRYDYTYRDHYGFLRYRVIWPRYRFLVHYGCGPRYVWRYFYPYYHRKYLFISLGGYWPFGYGYLRYYWYGCHPYYWYGYYPIAREVQSPTYNYYTYNYYTEDTSSQAAEPAIFEQIGQQDQGPDQITLTDVYFEEAVKAFEEGQYQMAALKFARAMELSPDDQILPFAYSQALIATEQYSEAARVLREALAKVRPEQEGVFYPRGLYPDEDKLLEQIDRLAQKAETFNYDADLQLLLGYQLLGIGEVDRAVEPLMHASEDLVNVDAAGILLNLAEKIKTSDVQTEGSQPTPPPQSKATIYEELSEPEEILLAEEIQVEQEICQDPEPELTLAPDRAEPANQPIEPQEAIYVADTKVIEANAEQTEFSPVLARSPTTNSVHPTKWKAAMFLASLCALATSAGIRGYIRG